MASGVPGRRFGRGAGTETGAKRARIAPVSGGKGVVGLKQAKTPPEKGVEAGGMVRETEGIGENGSVRGHGQGVVPIGA